MAKIEKTAAVELQQERAVMSVWLNRPDKHNALNPTLIAELTAVFQELGHRPDIRVVVLSSRGRSFCAGADLDFMRSAIKRSREENVAEGHALYDLLVAINQCPKPVIGRVNGAAIGGGIGLISCCDIVIAMERARFGFSEVKLGLVPAVIAPFVIPRIGLTYGRELFLSGEHFDAHHAMRVGLVNQVVADEEQLDEAIRVQVSRLLMGSPGAHEAAKELLRALADNASGDLRDLTAQLIARLRSGDEGQEGMSAFLEKRCPNWQPVPDGSQEGATKVS